jgi:hypothetical protein
LSKRAERYRDPSRDRAEADWLRARESVTDALPGLFTDQAKLRDALKGLHDGGQRLMDAGETGQDERFRKFVNDRMPLYIRARGCGEGGQGSVPGRRSLATSPIEGGTTTRVPDAHLARRVGIKPVSTELRCRCSSHRDCRLGAGR